MRDSLVDKRYFLLGALAVLSLLPGKIEYTSQSLRDPFLSPFEIEQQAEQALGVDFSHLRVQGMVWNSAIPQAIINERVLRQGDVIDGAEILDVQEEGVFILYEEKQYILRPEIPGK